jgi:hypothetical protein
VSNRLANKGQKLTTIEAAVSDGRGKPKRSLSRVSAKAARGVTAWLDDNDKRGPVARRFRDLVGLVTADLGGVAELSEAQRQIVRRIASMSVWCESEEAKMANGAEIDIDKFQRTSNSLRRLCETIGLRRVPKDATPLNLREYLKATAAQEAPQRAQANGAAPRPTAEHEAPQTLEASEDGDGESEQ